MSNLLHQDNSNFEISDKYFRFILRDKSLSILEASAMVVKLMHSLYIFDNDFINFKYSSHKSENKYSFLDGYDQEVLAESYLNDHLSDLKKYNRGKVIDINLIDEVGYRFTLEHSNKLYKSKFVFNIGIGANATNVYNVIILKFPKSRENDFWIESIFKIVLDNFEVDYGCLVSKSFIKNIHEFSIGEFWIGPINYFSDNYKNLTFDFNTKQIKYSNGIILYLSESLIDNLFIDNAKNCINYFKRSSLKPKKK
jgi:hypothetical protein